MSKKYKFDPTLSDDKNVLNKIAQMRELIWDKYPEHHGEMIASPFEVLCYYEKYTEQLNGYKEIVYTLKGILENDVSLAPSDITAGAILRVLNNGLDGVEGFNDSQ